MKLKNVKMKKTIIVLCCVIIASMGIVLTGCGNGSGEKKAESNTEKNVESSSEKNTESNSNKAAESNTEKNVESSSEKNTESNSNKDAESNTEKNVESSSEKNTESNSNKDAESNTEKNVKSNVGKSTESNNDKDAANLYVGTWESKIAECDGKEYDVKEIMGDFEVTFHADGTYSLLQDGNTTDGKWEPVEEGVKITENSGVEFSLTYQDEKLLMEITIGEISATYYFEKKK